MKKVSLLFIVFVTSVFTLFAQPIYNEDGIRLYHSPSQEEIEWARSKGIVAPSMAPMPPPEGELRPVAEFEPAEAVIIAHPFGIPMSLIKEMAKDIKVITIVASTSAQNTVLSQYNSNGVNTANCEFLIASTNTYWTRDYGPWFMAIDNEKVGMFDFTYNRPRPLDNAINAKLAPYLSNDGVQIDRYASTLVLTGGNYMNDGIKQGFSTTLVLNENSMTEAQLRVQYEQYLGINPYHFIADPIYPYDNIQHIDCWSKLLSPNKVLVARVPSSNPNYNKFEAAANYFAGLTSSWGMQMEVVRVDAPGATSDNPKTPYTNSLILNKKVFVPVNQTLTGNDNAALAVYENAMPGYEIIPIPYNSWLNTDALHCRTHEIADRCMLYVKHQPLFGNVQNTEYVNFNTELYSYCNNTIKSDSVFVYIKHSGGAYQKYNMQYTGSNTWEANVCGLPSGLIEYYIFAADESGRKECHPYIGAPDPHKFNLIGNPPPFPVLAIEKTNSSVTSEGFTMVEDFITVSNTGTADLTFEIAEINFPVMLTVTPLNGTVQPGGSQIITLSYNFGGVENGEYAGALKLLSNDCATPVVEISLQAIQNVTALVPALSLDKTVSSVTSTGGTVEDYITVSSVGNAELTFQITDIDFDEMLTIEPLDAKVQAGNSQVITLTYNFTAAKNTEYSGSFKLLSNDPENPEVAISLYAALIVGIDDVKLSTIYVYPNPATQSINVYYNGSSSVKAHIFDVSGRQHREVHITKELNAIDIQELPVGVYFISIEGHAFKFIKQ